MFNADNLFRSFLIFCIRQILTIAIIFQGLTYFLNGFFEDVEDGIYATLVNDFGFEEMMDAPEDF